VAHRLLFRGYERFRETANDGAPRMNPAVPRTIMLVAAPALLLASACAGQPNPNTSVERDLAPARTASAPAASGTAGAPAAKPSTAAAPSAKPEERSAKPAGDRPRPGSGSLRLVADLSARQLHLYEGDELVKSYAVAIGSPKYPTPRGSYRIRKIVWNPAWIPPDSKWARKETPKGPGERGNPMKVAKIFFKEPDYYIHGTGDTESLGDAASHGCLRMAPNDVAEVGQYVMEHGGQPRDESWFRRIFRFRSQTKVIYLDNPVPITVTG